jgi:membrane fusion protein (multidrug efflux system)
MKTSTKACIALIALGVMGAFALDGQYVAGARQFVMERLGTEQIAPAKASAPRSGKSAAVPVETAVARPDTASSVIEAIGSLLSDESVQISSEVAGRIADIAFKEGQGVEAGDILVRLDDAVARAELADAKARLELAGANYERTRSLAKTGSATERAQDEAKSALATARAAVELIEVRLEKLAIKAPFPGTAGIRNVSVGAYVTPGSPIANLEKIDELKADFKVPETFLSRIEVGQAIEVSVDALPGRTFPGKVYAIDPMVDVNGRALTIRARVPNPDQVLRPGLFARVKIQAGDEQEVVTVPEEAVVPQGKDNIVFKVVDGRAVATTVSLGARKAGGVEITKGIEPGQTVVTAGHSRLRDGSPVDVVTSASVATADQDLR